MEGEGTVLEQLYLRTSYYTHMSKTFLGTTFKIVYSTQHDIHHVHSYAFLLEKRSNVV